MASAVLPSIDPVAEPSVHAARAAAMAIAPGVLLAGVGGGIVFPILPLVGLRAGLSLPFIGVILAANRFGRVLVNPFVGDAVDRLGGKRLLLVGLLSQSIVLGFYLAGVLTGHPGAFFLLGRLLHGPSSACVFVASQALALQAGGARHRGLASGIVRSAMSAGMPVGLTLGGVLAGWLGPAFAFGAAMVAPLLAAGVAALRVPDLRSGRSEKKPTFAEIFASLRHRPVQVISALNAVTTFCALGVVLASLVLIIHARHLTPFSMSEQTASGAFMGVLVLFMMATSPLAGRLSDRPGQRIRMAMAGIAAMVPGILLVGVAASAPILVAGLALVGAGMGAVTTPLLAMLGDLVPPDERGRAIGCLQLFGDVGGVLGPIAGTSLLATQSLLPYAGTAALLAIAAVAAWRVLALPGADGGRPG